MSIIIRADNLTKTFVSQTPGHAHVHALNGISLEVREGEILGVLGPNGAGKTTFLNVLSTLIVPDSGIFQVAGIEGKSQNYKEICRLINLSSGYPNFPWSMTVKECLIFYGKLYGLRSAKLNSKINELLYLFDLRKVNDRRFDELSSGTKQRLSLAKAFLNDPKILFLDEPTVGLDPDAAHTIRQMIMRTIKETELTVLFTTHNMKEAEEMCKRIAFIKSGEIIKLATPQELITMEGKEDLEEVFIALAQSKKKSEKALNNIKVVSGMVDYKKQTQRYSFLGNVLNWINNTLAFAYRNYIFAIRNFFAFAELVFWPMVTLLSIGLLGGYLQLNKNVLTFILSGAIAGGMLQIVQLDVSYSLLYDVWSKSLKHTFVAPTAMSENLFGSWLIGIVRGFLVFLILAWAAVWFFNFEFPSFSVTLIFLSGIFCSAIFLGFLVSGLVLIFGQRAEITAWMFAHVVMLICGIYYPITTLPPLFYKIAQWLPVTYFLEYYRANIDFPSQFSHLLLKGFGLILFYLLVGLILLKFALQYARRKGIIIRVSE